MYQESMISFSYILTYFRFFAEFVRTLVYGLDLWFYPNAVLLWLSILLQYLTFITFTKQQWWKNRLFIFEWHRLPLSVSCDRQAVLCSMFVLLFCSCFVPFVPLISYPNCTLFFSVFLNFILLISRRYYYVFMLFPWLVLTILLL